MASATFWAKHMPSNSLAIIEFQLRDKKVRLSGVYFVQGNVIDIGIVNACARRARLILPTGKSWPPCVESDPFPSTAG